MEDRPYVEKLRDRDTRRERIRFFKSIEIDSNGGEEEERRTRVVAVSNNRIELSRDLRRRLFS